MTPAHWILAGLLLSIPFTFWQISHCKPLAGLTRVECMKEKIPTRNYPRGGSWLPQNWGDIGELGQALVNPILGAASPDQQYWNTISPEAKKDFLQNVSLTQSLNAMNSYRPNKPITAQSFEDSGLQPEAVNEMVTARRFFPQEYQRYMQLPDYQNQPQDFNVNIQRNTPYPTILRENFQDQVMTPVSNFARRVANLPAFAVQSFDNTINKYNQDRYATELLRSGDYEQAPPPHPYSTPELISSLFSAINPAKREFKLGTQRFLNSANEEQINNILNDDQSLPEDQPVY